MQQARLPFPISETSLRAFLSEAIGSPVELKLTANTSRVVSVRRAQGGVHLSMHRIFLTAPDEVLREVAAFVVMGGRTPLLNRFIRERAASVKRPPAVLRPVGAWHDLGALYSAVNGRYFGGSIAASITWSRQGGARVRRRTLGSYCFATGTIRVNPVLDSPLVPAFFVEFIVYHEMLHALLGCREGARRRVHTREFRQREREFASYAEALLWERSNRRIL